jgi:hypothetical protein
MGETCHRCGGELPSGSGESPFCPHCGAPQLYLSLDNQSPETGGERRESDTVAANAAQALRMRQIEWKTAIRCALAVAGVAGFLLLAGIRVPLLRPASLLWIVSGSLITMGLYERRQPKAWMDASVGARIGLVGGLCLVVGLGAVAAVTGVILRFGLHAMGSFDDTVGGIIQQVIQRSTTPFPPEAIQLAHSQEFRAAYILFVYAFFAGMLMVLSTLGGAFAGLMRTRRKSVA